MENNWSKLGLLYFLKLQKEYKNEKYFDTAILMNDFQEIEELTRQVANIYYIRPLYFEVFYKDEEERDINKIMAATYSYHYYTLSDKELELIENNYC